MDGGLGQDGPPDRATDPELGFTLDLHVHSRHSGDAKGSLAKIARVAKRRGLDGFAVTDHNTMAAHKEIDEAQDATGLRIIPGIEITSAEGHVIGLGVEAMVAAGMGLEETIEAVEDQGGVAIAAHPLRMFTGLGLSGLRRHHQSGVLSVAESHNGRERRLVTQNTTSLCQRLGLVETGGSDAHWVHDVGSCYTRFEYPLDDQEDILEAIRRKECWGEGQALPRRKVWGHGIRLLFGPQS